MFLVYYQTLVMKFKMMKKTKSGENPRGDVERGLTTIRISKNSALRLGKRKRKLTDTYETVITRLLRDDCGG